MKRTPSPLAAIVLLLAVGLTAAQTQDRTVATPRSPALEALDQVWELVLANFYDPELRGVDWALARERHAKGLEAVHDLTAAAPAINAMLAELDTSHTRFFTDADPAYYFLFDLFSGFPHIRPVVSERFPDERVGYAGIGVFTQQIDGETFVKAVVDGGPADRAGLRVGDRLIAIDGKPWQPVHGFAGRANQPVSVRIQRRVAPESVREIEVQPEFIEPVEFYLRAVESSGRIISQQGHAIAHVRMWSYAGGEYHRALESLVTTGKLAGAEALVLDLRDGWGGASPAYLNLFNHRVPVITGGNREGPVAFDSQWRKPVALLVNDGTRSGKELLAWGFREYDYGPVIGTRTAGAVTAGKAFPIGRSGLLYLAVGDARVDGVVLEGRGVEPDVEVSFPLPYANGRDRQLERALQVLVETLDAR